MLRSGLLVWMLIAGGSSPVGAQSLSEKGSDPLPSPQSLPQTEPKTRDSGGGRTPYQTASQTGPWLFRWSKGQILEFHVEHVTTATESRGGDTSNSRTKLVLRKQWEALEVDERGIATLELTFKRLLLELTDPKGNTLRFDSQNPAASDPALARELSGFLKKRIALLRVAANGTVLEVKESNQGPPSRFESELPFVIVLPGRLPATGGWRREYNITLAPPRGTGEAYAACQDCVLKSLDGSLATITLSTVLKKQPDSAAEEIPLLQLLPGGEVVFDTESGRLKTARLEVDREIRDHQGAGSSYRFRSTYVEKAADEK